MYLIYPTCVVCHSEWSSLEDEILRNNKTMWCCNGHYTIWYYQDKDGECSFEMEIDDINKNPYYQIRWNCHCMVPECWKKNVVTSFDENEEYKIIKKFDPPLSFNITKEQILELIK